MPDIIKLVNNIYAYQKGVQAINVTLLVSSYFNRGIITNRFLQRDYNGK